MKTQERENVRRYTECGLDDVFIIGMPVMTDDDDEETAAVPNINGLHRAIAGAVVSADAAMTGRRLRFIRTEMGLTMAELGRLVHKDQQSVGRWERGETPIDVNAETVLRLIAAERLGLEPPKSAAAVSQSRLAGAPAKPIRIDGRNPAEYRSIAA